MGVSNLGAEHVTPIHTIVPGRARLHAKGLHRSPTVKAVLENRLNGAQGIIAVSANTFTGNVLIHYHPDKQLTDILQVVSELLIREGIDHPGNRPGFESQHRKVPQLTQPAWHTLSEAQVASHWKTDLQVGLRPSQSADRLRTYGHNALPPPRRRAAFGMLAEQFQSLPVLLLAGSAVLSIITGGVADAVVIGAVMLLNAGIGFVTEYRAERVITALLKRPESQVPVIRDGQTVRISSREVVPGDVLVLHRGDEIAADARLVEAAELTVDESVLTGESLPVGKSPTTLADPSLSIGDRQNIVYRETVITGGSGKAIVIATGMDTEIGRIQVMIAETAAPETPIQRQLRALASGLGLALILGGLLAGSLFVLPQFLRGIQGYNATQASLFICIDAIATYFGLVFGAKFSSRLSGQVVVLIGLSAFAVANHLLTVQLTPDTPALNLYLILVLHGISLGIMVPAVSAILTATSVTRYLSFDMAIYYLFRGLGGVAGVSAIVALLDVRETFHSSRLLDVADRLSPSVDRLLVQLGQLLHAKGLSPDTAQLGS
jgi:Ca2+-transporting ATPase